MDAAAIEVHFAGSSRCPCTVPIPPQICKILTNPYPINNFPISSLAEGAGDKKHTKKYDGNFKKHNKYIAHACFEFPSYSTEVIM